MTLRLRSPLGGDVCGDDDRGERLARAAEGRHPAAVEVGVVLGERGSRELEGDRSAAREDALEVTPESLVVEGRREVEQAAADRIDRREWLPAPVAEQHPTGGLDDQHGVRCVLHEGAEGRRRSGAAARRLEPSPPLAVQPTGDEDPESEAEAGGEVGEADVARLERGVPERAVPERAVQEGVHAEGHHCDRGGDGLKGGPPRQDRRCQERERSGRERRPLWIGGDPARGDGACGADSDRGAGDGDGPFAMGAKVEDAKRGEEGYGDGRVDQRKRGDAIEAEQQIARRKHADGDDQHAEKQSSAEHHEPRDLPLDTSSRTVLLHDSTRTRPAQGGTERTQGRPSLITSRPRKQGAGG